VLDAVFAPPGPRSVWLDWGLPIALAISTAVSLRLSPGRRFALTPLDLIVLFIALVVPNLPGLRGIPQGGAIAIAKVVILFYALELLSSQMVKSALWLRLAVVALIAGLLGRDWLFAAYGHGTVIAPS
jgi:UDP-GlcNAc:undecaprenyl-phosphate/decaprenyl-phosphate GlcNAc-1-phosphate transferase